MFCSRWENTLSDYSILRFLRRSKNQTVKLSKKKLQNKTINFTSYIFSTHTPIPLGFFFIHFFYFWHLYQQGSVCIRTFTPVFIYACYCRTCKTLYDELITYHQVCSIILLQKIHLQLHVKLSFHSQKSIVFYGNWK